MGIRELKNKLSHYIRLVEAGETVLVTDRGTVVAELGAPKDPSAYPKQEPLVAPGRVKELLDAERGER